MTASAAAAHHSDGSPSSFQRIPVPSVPRLGDLTHGMPAPVSHTLDALQRHELELVSWAAGPRPLK